jgi:hypothetical protein
VTYRVAIQIADTAGGPIGSVDVVARLSLATAVAVQAVLEAALEGAAADAKEGRLDGDEVRWWVYGPDEVRPRVQGSWQPGQPTNLSPVLYAEGAL